jgi:hypothetical protein
MSRLLKIRRREGTCGQTDAQIEFYYYAFNVLRASNA